MQQPLDATFRFANGDIVTASASSYYLPNLEAPFRALFGPESSEYATANQWTTGTASYVDDGKYAGTYSCCRTPVEDAVVAGEWLQVHYEAPKTFTAFSIMSNQLNNLRAPRAFVLAGSTDGVSWTALHKEDGIETWGKKEKRTFQIQHPKPMNYYRLVVQSTVGTEGWLTVDKLLFI
jgi:hypothetical protein